MWKMAAIGESMERKDLFKTLIWFLVLETIFTFVINALPFMTYFRYLTIVVAIVMLIGYWKSWRKVNAWFVVLILLTLGYTLMMTLLYKEPMGVADQIALPIAAIACLCIGVSLSFHDKAQNTFLYALYSGLIVIGFLSLFYTLYSFGFFYILKYPNSSLIYDAEMFVGVEFALVDVRYFGYYFCLLSSGLSSFWFGRKEKGNLKVMAMIAGVLGLVAFLVLPYWIGLILSCCGLLLSLGICYFPKQKRNRIITYSIMGLFLVLAFSILVIKRNSIPRLQLIFDVMGNCFQYPLGGQPTFETYGVSNSYNIFIDALAVGGILPFLFLIALFGYTIFLSIRYYRHSNDSLLKKGCVITFLIHYFIYVNLNYKESIFIEYNDRIPMFFDPMLCVVLILVGYMFYQQKKNDVKRMGNEEK